MWHFLSTLLAMLTAFSIVSVYGQRCLLNFITWLFTDALWWCLGACWWLVTHILLPLFGLSAIISLAYLFRLRWNGLMNQWEWEKEHTSKIKRVGE